MVPEVVWLLSQQASHLGLRIEFIVVLLCCHMAFVLVNICMRCETQKNDIAFAQMSTHVNERWSSFPQA